MSFPAVGAVRPTPDRVRETVFNWLGDRVAGAVCLDLFAGSGALGLEAASRGAAHVTLVDNHPGVVRALGESVRALEAGNVDVHCDDALAWLGRAGEAIDIVFLDPPYAARDLLDSSIALIDDRGILAPGGRLYLEYDANRVSPRVPEGWSTLRSGRAGDAGFQLLAHTGATPETSGKLV